MNIQTLTLRTLIFLLMFGGAMAVAQCTIRQRFGVSISNFYVAAFTCGVAIFVTWFGFIRSNRAAILVGLWLFTAFWTLKVLKRLG
jgi:hypothetical protein